MVKTASLQRKASLWPDCCSNPLLCMKLASILFLTLMLQVSAIAKGQEKVTLSAKNERLEAVLTEVEKQTGYVFFFDEKILTDAKPVSIRAENMPLEKFLETVLKEQSLKFSFKNKTIAISRATLPVAGYSMPGIIFGVIKGKVTDESGNPLPGASVVVKGTGKGTSTDANGAFTLSIPESATTLIISFIGFEPQMVDIKGNAEVIVKLKSRVTEQQGVTVVALGIKRSVKSLTYTTQKVELNPLGGKDPNIANALVGKVAGLQLSNAASGVGASARIVLRGNRSISGNNQALIIVDGVPIDNTSNPKATFDSYPNSIYRQSDGGDGISSINPDDIESINVIKGASGAALYGARASNGVIIITTKKGKGAGKIGLDANLSYGVQTPEILRKYQNVYGQGNGMTYNKTAVSNWGPAMGASKVPYWSNNPNYSGAPDYTYQAQPNNVKDFFTTGNDLSASVGANAGNETIQGYFSYSYTGSNGILSTNQLKRHTISIRLTSNLGKHLVMDAKANYINQNIDGRVFTGENDFNPARQIYRIPRNIALADAKDYEYTDDNGNIRQHFWAPNNSSLAQNPFWIMNNVVRNDKRDRLLGFVSAVYHFTDDLSLQVRTGLDTYFDRGNTKIHNDTYVRALYGDYRTDQFNVSELNTDFLFTWKKKINQDFSFNLYAGGNQLHQKRIGQVSSNTQLLKPNFFVTSNAMNLIMQPNYYERMLNSLYSSFQVSYRQYAFLDITGRNDWSSTLPASNRSFFYPSAGLSLVLSSMFKMPAAISFAKIRSAFAEVGNDAQPYLTYQTYNFSQGGSNGYLVRNTTSPFPVLKPEKTRSIEAGADVRFWNDRLGVDFSVYKSNSYNQLITVAIPSSSGFVSQYINAGNIQNTGMEVLLNASPVLTKNFKWDLSVNYSRNVSLVKSLADNVKKFTLNSDYIATTVAEEGKPYGSFYVKGFQRDIKGNIIVGSNGVPLFTSSQNVYAGNFNHDWISGVTNKFSYKNLVFSFLIDIRQGGKAISFTDAVLAADGSLKETLPGRDGSLLVNGVLSDGTSNTKKITAEQYWTSVGGRNNPVGEMFVYDASNIRLREVSLGYTFPERLLKKSPATKLSVSAYGRNLFFFQNLAKNFDPEVSSGTGNVQGVDAFSLPYTSSYGITFHASF